MKEISVRFGEEGRLSGGLTCPEGKSAVVCVLVTAGLVAKPGPFRLYTQIARRLARGGAATLRFDLGGVGDSTAVSGGALRERTEREVRAAVDHMTKVLPEAAVVLAGLCSGAEDAFLHAEGDPRVRGLVLMDPFSYRTSGWRRRDFARRVRRRLYRAANVFVPIERARKVELSGGGSVVQYRYLDPTAARRVLGTLVSRRVQTHFIYTGGALGTFNHAGQLAKMFPDLDLRETVSLDHLPEIEHTQILAEDRDLLVDRIAGWFDRFAAGQNARTVTSSQ